MTAINPAHVAASAGPKRIHAPMMEATIVAVEVKLPAGSAVLWRTATWHCVGPNQSQKTRKIMHAPEILVSATCVRIPVTVGHSEAVHVELTHPMDPAETHMRHHTTGSSYSPKGRLIMLQVRSGWGH